MRQYIGHRPFPHHRAHRDVSNTGQAITIRWAREALIIAVAILLYFTVRGLVDARQVDAFQNAGRLIRFEQWLGIFQEPRFQDWALDWKPLATIANWVYIWGHWPVIVLTLTWLVIAHREHYPVYRNALLISGAVGLVIFFVLPMAPPRFMTTYGFVDTVTLHSDAYRVLQPPALVNQFAAMPSLHCGWDLLMGIAIARHAPSRIRWIGYVLPITMYLAVVLTANHYFLDGVAGEAIVIVSLLIAQTLNQRSLARQSGTATDRQSPSPA